MKLTQKQIAEAFSKGFFEITYPFLADNIEWKVIHNFECKGKKEVIEQCEKATKYFESITTDFTQLDILESKNNIAITGTANFSQNGKLLEFISACDVYEFNHDGQLLKITSYCVIKSN